MQSEPISATFHGPNDKDKGKIVLGLHTDLWSGQHDGVFINVDNKQLVLDAKNAELLAYQMSRFAMYLSLIQEHGINDTTSPAAQYKKDRQKIHIEALDFGESISINEKV